MTPSRRLRNGSTDNLKYPVTDQSGKNRNIIYVFQFTISRSHYIGSPTLTDYLLGGDRGTVQPCDAL